MRTSICGSAALFAGLLALLFGSAAMAAVTPNVLFSDGAVLQQGISVPVWGTAGSGETVTVTFQHQKVTTTAAKDGSWIVRLDPLRAGGPFTMAISGENKIELKNVLVGEVWICSGQSNMEFGLGSAENAKQAIDESKDPMLHLFTVTRQTSFTPMESANAAWKECGPDTVKPFSAVGYFFGRDLRRTLKVPVGLINSSWGGTYAQAWTSKAGLQSVPEFRPMLIEAAKKPADKSPNHPTVLYNGMIAPLRPYALRGAIWYQGESNAYYGNGAAYQYRTLLPTMIQSWRDAWGQGDFPFLIVQIAPYMTGPAEPEISGWALVREGELLTSQHCPNTAMAVITDVGNPHDIHPRKKEPVGGRLALAARAIAYKQRLLYSGPIYKSMKVQGDGIVLSFNNIGKGLEIGTGMEPSGGKLTGFTIAGADKKFVSAEATIVGKSVVVKSAQVPHPVAVRYGWADCPFVNLQNKEGIPASPFRTDDFQF